MSGISLVTVNRYRSQNHFLVTFDYCQLLLTLLIKLIFIDNIKNLIIKFIYFITQKNGMKIFETK